ncbi:hypothetical protein ABPG74_009906 [Tetrahymena malaccensis]
MNQKRYIQIKRPHSTNIQGTRAGKISTQDTTNVAQNYNLKSNTQETNKRNKQKQIITQVQKINTGSNFYQKNENNENFISITSQDNEMIEEYRNINLKSVMFSQDSQHAFDGNNYNNAHNSLQMSTGFIEPPNNIYTDASFKDDHRSSNKFQQNLSNIVQSHQSKVQKTNAFHTKIPPKKQNQTQMLIKYINNEGQSLNIKQIERANLIQQHHFYDDLFMGNQKNQLVKNNNQKDSANKNNQMINVQNFNKSFYVQVNVSQQLCNKRNSVDSNLLMATDDQGKQCISEQVNTHSTAKNLFEHQNQNHTQDQFLRKGGFPGRKLSILNKETLNLIVKKLSQSMHQESRLSASSLNNSQEINLNHLGQQNKMQKASQTNTNNFFNRNYSFQINNRAQTANKTNRDSQKQTCVKGISIKKYYRSQAISNILSNQGEENSNNLSLSMMAPQNQQYQQQQRRLTSSQELVDRNSQNQYLSSYQNLNQSQIENKIQSEQEDKDYQINILSQEYQELQTEENNNQNQQINFLKGQAECYNSNIDLDQQITCFIKDPKYANVVLQNKKKRSSSNFLSQSQTHRSKDSNANKAQTSFNFYQQNQNQQLNSTGTNFKMNQSQLVEHSNHIERKLSNMSQDSHPYLETLVFGEFGTLESAVAKSNHQNKREQLNFNEQQELFQFNADDQAQQYPLSSRYAEKNQKSKSKNLNRKLKKTDKNNNKLQKGLDFSNGSETVCDLTSFNDDKSLIKNKKRCASAREQVFQSQILQNESLKDKFLKNLNLRGQRQVSQEDLRSVGSQISLQEQLVENQTNQPNSIDKIQTKQNQDSFKNLSQNNLNDQLFHDDSNQIQQNNNELYQKQPSNEYSTLLKVYERSLANRTIDQQEEEQILQKSQCEHQNVTRRKSVLIVKNDNYSHLSENSENLSNLKQVYNNQSKGIQNQNKLQNENINTNNNGTKLSTHPTVENNQRQNTSTLNTDHQVMSTQNTSDVNSRYLFNQTIKNQELNGIFLPYQKEEQQACKTSSQQKIIHSNFPQKINSKFLQQKNPTNSQLFSFLLQKQNMNQNIENSILAINKRNTSLNNSQLDINNIKQSNQSNYQQRGNSLNTSVNFNHNLYQKDSQKQKSKQTNYMLNNKIKANDLNNQDADELLQPWNDYTYVKYF